MSDESVEAIRRAIEAFNAGDVEQMLALADPELEWRPPFGAATDGAPPRTTDTPGFDPGEALRTAGLAE